MAKYYLDYNSKAKALVAAKILRKHPNWNAKVTTKPSTKFKKNNPKHEKYLVEFIRNVRKKK